MEEGPRGFKIDFTEEESGTPAKKEPKKTPKAGRPAVRPAFIWLLALFAIGSLLFAGYYHLHSRIRDLESMGENQLSGLSGKIDERLSSISQLVNEQRELIRNRVYSTEKKADKNTEAIEDIKKSVDTLRNNLSSLEKRLRDKINKLGKNTEELQSSVNQHEEKLEDTTAAVEKLRSLKSDIKETGDGIKETKSSIEALDERITAMQQQWRQEDSRAEELEQKLEQKTEELRRSLQKQLESGLRDMQGRINKINDQTQALEAMINTLEDMQKENAQRNADSQESSDSSREIIEQELE